MSEHMDMMKDWWEHAEQGIASKGDTVIEWTGGTYEVYQSPGDRREELSYLRILERAPKPKPAWHDAVAVMAALDRNSYDAYGDTDWPTSREVWVRDGEAWSNDDGITVPPERLIDVTPLVEAKVTDEMVARAREHMSINTGQTHTPNAIRGTLTAALGLETE